MARRCWSCTSSIPRRKLSTLPAPGRRMRWSRRSRNWTSFSSPWTRARDGHEVVDLAVSAHKEAEALLGHDRNGLVLTLRYAPEAVERVRAMVASEQHCCAFLNFDVREQPDVVRVTITAPENARDAADELLEQFTAADHVNR